MSKYVCSVCGYVYDEVAGAPESGISEGTLWENVYEDFFCPLCGAAKDMFDKE
jgi:rubredoxin